MKKITFLLLLLTGLKGYPQLTLIKNLATAEVPSLNTISNNALYNNKAYYLGKNTVSSTPLYSSDGTDVGTTLVKELGVSYPSNMFTPSELALFTKTSNKLFFLKSQTNDDFTSRTTEIWVTDGTSVNTTMIASRVTAGSSIFPYLLRTNDSFGDLNGASENFINDKLIFIGYNPDLPTVTSTNMILYISDGTAIGTTPLLSSSGEKIYTSSIGRKLNGKYYFSGRTTLDFNSGTRLWVTDGTQAGTHIVNTSQADPSFFVDNAMSSAINGKILFWGGNSATGYEVWETDGTDAGTVLFREFVAGSNDSQPNYGNALNFFHDGTKVYFLLQLDNATPNFQLWATDGTSVNTAKLIDLNTLNELPEDVSLANGKFYFRTRGKKIFVSDGTAAGTYFVKTLNKNANPIIKNYNGSLFYDDYDVSTITNNELWRCDGTTSNTTRIFDIYPGTITTTISNSSNPRNFFILGGDLFFVANIAGGAKLYKFRGDFTFNGSTDTSWNVGTNWNATITPGINDLVTIPSGQTVNVNSNGFFKNAIINGNVNLVSGNLDVYGDAILSNSAKMTLNANNLNLKGNLSSISGNISSYIITNTTGKVFVENLDTSRGNVSLPIGTVANFNPVTISNLGVSDIFSARVETGIASNYVGEVQGNAITEKGVNATWFISEGVAGGSNSNIQLQWNGSQELANFDRPNAKMGHYNGSVWESLIGTFSGANPYVYSVNGVSNFSPFAILNDQFLGTTEFEFNAFKLYPNPSNGEFTMKTTPEMLGAKVVIFNAMGQKIKSFELLTLETMQNLNSGLYIISIEKEGKKAVKKLIVK